MNKAQGKATSVHLVPVEVESGGREQNARVGYLGGVPAS